MSDPIVSIVIASLNAIKTLPNCLNSILDQTYDSLEVIVVDGASIDGTIQFMEGVDDHRLTWLSEPDDGVAAAWNKGTKLARGRWICFLGADDVFLRTTALEQITKKLSSVPNDVVLVYSGLLYLCGNQVIGRKGSRWRDPWSFWSRWLSVRLPVPHPGAFHRKNLFAEYGGFDESFRIAMDTEFLIRVMKVAGNRALYVKGEPCIGMEIGSGLSTSPARALEMASEVLRLRRRHGLPFSIALGWLFA